MTHSSLPLSFAKISTLFACIGLLGCDAAEPNDSLERDAVLVLEVDGEAAEDIDVSDPLRVEADLVALSANEADGVCEGSTMDLVLEVGGNEVASAQTCAPAAASGPDSLAAAPDVQAAPWCQFCEQSNENDCFSCCKCDGGSTWSCQLQCW